MPISRAHAANCEAIPYDDKKRRLTITARVSDHLGRSNNFDAVIDTGATNTLIPKKSLEGIKHRKVGVAQLQIADGKIVQGDIVQVYALVFRGVIIRDVTLTALPIDNNGKGLIGMSELSRLNWRFEDGVFLLCKK